MPYCILADIEKLIPEATVIQLTDDAGAGVVNTDVVDAAIGQGDEEIDTYMGSRYTAPMSPVPGIVKKLSVDIAIYNLYSRRMEEIPPLRSERYKNAIKLLGQIAAGTVSIGESTEPDGGGQVKVSTSVEDRIFTKGKKSDGSSGSLDNY